LRKVNKHLFCSQMAENSKQIPLWIKDPFELVKLLGGRVRTI
jgi:hypothetical protein